MSRGQLYERLLDRFARREVAKAGTDRSEADLDEDVEFELERLSVVALGMFNRGVQWVAEHEVTADLVQLLGMDSPDRMVGAQTRLSAGETVLGRFFFVQKTEAVREDRTKLRTYEFLHATFGEYLMARLIWDRLTQLRKEDEARSKRKSTVDDTELYSVLSFMALTTSKPVLDFLREFAEKSDRDGLLDLVSRLIVTRDETRGSRGDYVPVALTDSVRDAKYSLNLVVLALVLRQKVYADELSLSVDDWQRLALFWKSRLSSSEWASVVLWFWMERDADRHFAVSLSNREREAQAEWLLMSEPYVTLDEVSTTLRDAVTPWASVHGIEMTAALVGLAAAPVEKCLPAMRRLQEVAPTNEELFKVIYHRLGKGGDDVAMLDLMGRFTLTSSPHPPLLDAWLRLHEQGFVFSSQVKCPSVVEVLHGTDFDEVAKMGREDLVKRAKVAAAELGLAWPPSKRRRGRRGRDR
jgi:hypothetical protein